MTTLKELEDKARQKPKYPGKTVNLVLNPSDDGDEVLAALIQYFGEDDSRKAIQLTVGGEEVGFITRHDLYEYAPETIKGIGAGDHAILPSPPEFRLIRLRCPVCDYAQLVMLYKADDPPRCTSHPDQVLEIVK